MISDEGNSIEQVAAIEFRNVSISFDEVRALDNVSFKLRRNQTIVITGVSQSGKSVLLHLAIGLLLPDEGQILIEGQDITRMDEEQLLEIRSGLMGLVFQEDNPFTALSVFENAAYRLREHNWPEAKIEEAVTEILSFVGLDKDTDKLPEELSVGMRRRLEIARALAGWPRIMLFDEPTSGLDPINARQVLDLIIRARDIHKISSLFVTKEMHEISYLVTHLAEEDEAGEVTIQKAKAGREPRIDVMVLDQGKVEFHGSPAEFQASTSPAVTQLVKTRFSAQAGQSYIADPWSKNRRLKQNIIGGTKWKR
jgi:phospholipid/cholesterol/gamma-HCH transport system ATP-binding protein